MPQILSQRARHIRNPWVASPARNSDEKSLILPNDWEQMLPDRREENRTKKVSIKSDRVYGGSRPPVHEEKHSQNLEAAPT